jgi:hypothetical protein
MDFPSKVPEKVDEDVTMNPNPDFEITEATRNQSGKLGIIDEHRGEGGGRGVRSEKLSHKNAIKHKKGKKSGPPRFSDNPKNPPKKNLAKNPKDPPSPLWISNYCASMLNMFDNVFLFLL